MTATTTVLAVQRIIPNYDPVAIPSIQPFIDDAILLVDAVIGTADSDAILEIVTRYITAHAISVADALIASEQVKSLQVSYQYKLDKGLAITHYGTMAMTYDTSGKLAAWNKKVVAGYANAQFFYSGNVLPVCEE